MELKPGESAVLQSGPLALTDQKSLIVKFYEAVDGIQLKACSNDVNTGCQDLSKVGVAAGDRSWQTTSYPIPKDTTKVTKIR